MPEGVRQLLDAPSTRQALAAALGVAGAGIAFALQEVIVEVTVVRAPERTS